MLLATEIIVDRLPLLKGESRHERRSSKPAIFEPGRKERAFDKRQIAAIVIFFSLRDDKLFIG